MNSVGYEASLFHKLASYLFWSVHFKVHEIGDPARGDFWITNRALPLRSLKVADNQTTTRFSRTVWKNIESVEKT